MTIYLNEKAYQAEEGVSLAAFVQQAGIPTQGVAIAIANRVIPRKDWEATQLTEGTEILLIHAVSGG